MKSPDGIKILSEDDKKRMHFEDVAKVAKTIYIAKFSNPLYGPSMRAGTLIHQARVSFDEAEAFFKVEADKRKDLK